MALQGKWKTANEVYKNCAGERESFGSNVGNIIVRGGKMRLGKHGSKRKMVGNAIELRYDDRASC